MPFVKGQSGNPHGRNPGKLNSATINAREAIAAFVEGNVTRLNGWLDRIAEDDPRAAFAAFMDVVEYHIPKLARQEITGKDGAALKAESELCESDRALLERWQQQKEAKNNELSRRAVTAGVDPTAARADAGDRGGLAKNRDTGAAD